MMVNIMAQEAQQVVKSPKPTDDKKKRRKCTYAARRAEEIREEVRKVESKVTVLKIRAAVPGQEHVVDAVLERAKAKNAKLNEAARAQQLRVAEMQSAMSQCRYGVNYYLTAQKVI